MYMYFNITTRLIYVLMKQEWQSTLPVNILVHNVLSIEWFNAVLY